MKGFLKPIVGLSVLLATLFTSCTKNSTGDLSVDGTKRSNVNLELIKEVESLPRSVAPLGYKKLTSEEKVTFWLRHVDQYLKDHPEFSPELVAHINKLKAFAHVDLYDKMDDPAMKQYVQAFEKKWYLDPIEKGTFPAKALTEVSSFWGVGKPEQTLGKLQKTALTADNESSSCNCYYSLSCPSNQYCWKKDECGPNSGAPANCGIFGNSRCEGKCAETGLI